METTLLRDVQHLLRHLQDAALLRGNRLVADVFANATTSMQESVAVSRVRSRVASAVQVLRDSAEANAWSTERRSYEILERCDLRGELHRVVASELGLSERQFYRERRKACVALGQLLSTWREPRSEPAIVQTPSTPFEWELACADELQNLGQFAAAYGVLQKLAAAAPNPLDRLRAWCKAAIVLQDSGDLDRARDALASAVALVPAESSGIEHTIAEAEVAAVRGTLAWASGATGEAIAWNRRVLDGLRPFERLPQRGIELAALALLDTGNFYRELGEVTQALAAVAEGRAVLAYLAEPPASIRLQLNLGAGAALTISAGGLPNAERELLEAFEFARRSRLLRGVVDISSMLGIVALFRGDISTATHYGRTAVALAQTVSGPIEFANTALNAARAELLAGRPSAALELTTHARAHLTPETLQWTMCDLCEAETLIRLGRPHRAAAIAASVVERLERLGVERYLGSALHVLAEALAAAGAPHEAAQRMDESIAVLEHRGHPFSLARAYAYSATLTGNARHRSNGRDLSAMLRA